MLAALGLLLASPARADSPLELTAPHPPTPGASAEEAPLPPPRSSFEDAPGVRDARGELRLGGLTFDGASPSLAARLRVLEADLRLLALQNGGGLVDGVVSLVSGGLFVGLALALEDTQTANYLYLVGGTTAARGLLQLLVAPDPEEASLALEHMPMGSPQQAAERLRFAEDALRETAQQARWLRILESALNMGAALAVIPLFLAPADYELVGPLSYFVVIGAAVGFVGGAITLLTPSQAERRWAAYEKLRDRLEREPLP